MQIPYRPSVGFNRIGPTVALVSDRPPVAPTLALPPMNAPLAPAVRYTFLVPADEVSEYVYPAPVGAVGATMAVAPVAPRTTCVEVTAKLDHLSPSGPCCSSAGGCRAGTHALVDRRDPGRPDAEVEVPGVAADPVRRPC